MPLIKINSGPEGLYLHEKTGPPAQELQRALEGGGPVILMLHGYKFTPGHSRACPHEHILSLTPRPDCRHGLSWPDALGAGRGSGLAVAFGWPARGRIWSVYKRAAQVGHDLARLIRMIRQQAPHRPVHILAHSLGARVALSALPHLARGDLGRMILLSGAEYGAAAAAALECPAGRSTEIVSVTSGENDLFDFLLERAIAPPRPGARILSHGLTRPNLLTLQLDKPGVLAGLSRLGFDIAPPEGRISHWSTYMRPGVFDLYRALLRAPDIWSFNRLRCALPGAPDPRWTRLLAPPEIRLPRPSGWRAPS